MAAAAIAMCCDRHPDRRVYREVAGTKMCRECFTDGKAEKKPQLLGPSRPSRYLPLEATLKAAQAYLPKCRIQVCIKCGTTRTKNMDFLCMSCKHRARKINEVKTRLRGWQEQHCVKRLQTAMALVPGTAVQDPTGRTGGVLNAQPLRLPPLRITGVADARGRASRSTC